MEDRTNLYATRRTFIKSAGALAAGAAAMASIAPAFAEENDAAASVNDISWDEERELVIVGAGFGGLNTAAAAIADCGGTDIVVFEKGVVPGGCSPFSVCRYTYTTQEYRDDFVAYMKALDRGCTTVPDDVYEAFADGTIEAIDWAVGLGANKDEMVIEEPGACSPTQPGGYPEYPELEGSISVGNFQLGQAEGAEGPTSFYRFLQEYLEEHTDVCEIRYSSPVTALVQDPTTKAVLGVVVESEGSSFYIRATKAVVMACGGFENATDMLQNYFGLSEVTSGGATLNTGDGHRMCMRAGADMWHMHQMSGLEFKAHGINDGMVSFENGLGIVVGLNGRRYLDDSGYGIDAGAVEFPGFNTRPVSMGDTARHGLLNFGGQYSLPQLHDSWFICDANAYAEGAISVTDFDGDDPYESGEFYRGETLTELARQLGLPEGCLEQTVEDWNIMVDAGHDFAFHRPENTLLKIEAAPFYAIQLKPNHINTDGGPRRSAKAEILDVDGMPIPGLYSCGEFGSITGMCYQGGCNISEGNVFGRIAAHQAYGVA